MYHQDVIEEIIALKTADLALRDRLVKEGKLFEGYHKAMEELHISNAHRLNEIIDQYGFPILEKIGKEASQAAWLVVQHAISLPSFMKRYQELLMKVESPSQISKEQLAYLSDRIAVFEEQPQLFCTQFDWDANGLLSPQKYDDLSTVNKRRNHLGWNTVEEQTQIIRAQAVNENNHCPNNLESRQQEMKLWKYKVGWLRKS
ncbi:hypothetical protein LX97_02971 [Nonlabens dokdonensis]|uniref:Uncharacterized protein n=3 Tax=Nonlabens dokdonensis TaxID=328515 RepID=L7WH01_NONDD|nr:hypothetical protein DDD_3106 [Nonlabens dokdonensis DSW-6]PZX37876.1 hypothetical protein LX97_02971 [Nonlabens dokdonensis]